MKSKYLLPLFLFLFIQQAVSQKTLTLYDCIQLAKENNIQLKQNQLMTKLSEFNIEESKGYYLPSINAGANHNYNFGRAIDPFTNQFTNQQVRSNNFFLSANLTIFNGFQNHNNYQQKLLDLQASQLDLQALENDISLNIASLYLQILFNEELALIERNQIILTEQQIERTEKLIDAGKLAPVVIHDLKAQKAGEEVKLIQAENQIRLSYINLSQLLNLEGKEAFTIVRPDSFNISPSHIGEDIHKIIANATNEQPSIKAAEIRTLSATKAVAVAKGRYIPRLTMGASLSTLYSSSSQRLIGFQETGRNIIGTTQDSVPVYAGQYQSIFEKKPFSNQVSDNLNKFVGLTLTIPILNGLQTRTSVSKAKINVLINELNLELSRNQLENNIQIAYADAIAAEKQYKASEASVAAMDESYRNTEKRFEAGLVNSFEYSQIKIRLINTQSDLLQAKYTFAFKIKVLDFYNGKEIK